MTKSLELTDKLDAPASPVVNGPEDDVLDWLSVDWQTVEDDVRRLRQRIFTGSRKTRDPVGLLEPGAVKAARRGS
jgi:RNA-directed DNA polymerase